MDEKRTIGVQWRIHLGIPPQEVFPYLATPEGRARFWAVEAPEPEEGTINFSFVNGEKLTARILRSLPPHHFSHTYFEESRVDWTLEPDGTGGTDLTLEESGLSAAAARENVPGWVSVLLLLKAAAGFGIDLRNHDPGRTWNQGYVDVS